MLEKYFVRNFHYEISSVQKKKSVLYIVKIRGVVPTVPRCTILSGAASGLAVKPPPRIYWEPWLVREPLWGGSVRPGGGCSGPSPFYVVWRGRVTGVFYKWYHVRRSVAGFDGAVFKGFPSLSAA